MATKYTASVAQVDESPMFMLNGTDYGKIFRGLLIASAGAALTYVSEQIPNIDFGTYTPVAVAAWSVIVNIFYRWLSGPTEVK